MKLLVFWLGIILLKEILNEITAWNDQVLSLILNNSRLFTVGRCVKLHLASSLECQLKRKKKIVATQHDRLPVKLPTVGRQTSWLSLRAWSRSWTMVHRETTPAKWLERNVNQRPAGPAPQPFSHPVLKTRSRDSSLSFKNRLWYWKLVLFVIFWTGLCDG